MHGWGPFSDIVTIRADDVPAQSTPVQTAESDINVRIQWAIPTTNNGSPIVQYRVKVETKTGTFIESPSCDGGISEILIMANPWCLISMVELRSTPYSLV